MRYLIASLVCVMLLSVTTGVLFADTAEKVPVNHARAFWMWGGQYNQPREQHALYVGSLPTTGEWTSLKKSSIDVVYPSEFFVGHAAYIKLELTQSDISAPFVRITKLGEENIQIANMTNVFSYTDIPPEKIPGERYTAYSFSGQLDTSGSTIHYVLPPHLRRVEAHLLALPHSPGEHVILLEVGEGDKVLHSVEVVFQVKQAPAGITASYHVNAELSGRFTFAYRDNQQSSELEKPVRVHDSKKLGVLKGDAYADIKLTGTAEVSRVGRINLKDANGFAIINPDGYLLYETIQAIDRFTDFEIEVRCKVPFIDGYGVQWGGKLTPSIQFFNEVGSGVVAKENTRRPPWESVIPFAVTPLAAALLVSARKNVFIRKADGRLIKRMYVRPKGDRVVIDLSGMTLPYVQVMFKNPDAFRSRIIALRIDEETRELMLGDSNYIEVTVGEGQ